MNTDAGLGFAHFISQSDVVGKTLLAILVLMSVLSWAILALKGLTLAVRRRRSQAFLDFFWNASSLDAVAGEIATHGTSDPFSHLASHAMQAAAHHAKDGAARLAEAGSASDFVTRTIKKVLDEETTRLDAFAYELHTFVSMGQPMAAAPEGAATTSTVRALAPRASAA